MDPLSIIASIGGILAVTSKVISTLTTFSKKVTRCPASAQNILREAAALHACVSQVQALILGDQEAETSRMQLLMVEHLVVTLSNCVLTMSELDQVLDSLKLNRTFTARSRLRWMREEQYVAELLASLQASKTSLTLMMATLTCSSVREAHSSVANIVTIVNELLDSNHELSWRMANMQMQLEGSDHANSTIRYPLASMNETTSRRSTKLLSWKPNNLGGYRASSIGNFDQVLQRDLRESPVYARNRRRDSRPSMSSSAVQSLGPSFLSNCSLAAISNISVVRLPIYSRDLWNPQCYRFSDDLDNRPTEELPSTDTASIVTAKTESDSLIEELLVRKVPDYKIALLGTNLGGNSTLLMLLYLSWIKEAANSSRHTHDTILQHIQTTFVNVETLIKEHKLQVDNEVYKLLETIKSFRVGSSATSDGALVESCERLCQDRDIRVVVEWECPTYLAPNWKSTPQRNLNLGIEDQEAMFLHQLDFFLGHCTDSNKDVLHMIHDNRGRNRILLRLSDVREKYSVQMTSIVSHHALLTRRTLAEVDHVFYVVSLCSYCKTLSGHPSQNEMEASIKLFSLMSRLNVMRTTPITVFFTQADIFPQRIVDVPVKGYFPDYEDGTDAVAAITYLASKFRMWDHRNNAQLHLFAPGLCGPASFQDALDKVKSSIICDLHERQ